MRTVKFVTSSVIIIVLLFLIGELRYLEIVYSINNKFPKAEFSEKIVNINSTVADSAEEIFNRSGCEIFFIKYEYPSMLETNAVIMCREEIIPTLKNNFSITSYNYKSFLAGRINILFEAIPEEHEITGINYVYFFGDNENVKNAFDRFKTELGGGNFYESSYDGRYKIIEIAAIALSMGIIALLSAWDLEYMKKYFAVRIIYGEDPKKLFIKELSVNICFYFIAIFAGGAFVSMIDDILKNMDAVIWVFVLSAVVTTIIYSKILNLDLVDTIKGRNNFRRINKLSYVLKLITLTLAAVSGAAVGNLFPEFADTSAADRFFSQIQNGYFCDFQTDFDLSNINTSREYYGSVNEKIYREYYDRMSPFLLSQTGCYNDTEIIYANSNTKEYLRTIFDDDNFKTDTDIIIFIPEKLRNTNAENTALKCYEQVEHDGKYTYTTVYIGDEYNIISIDSDLSRYYKVLKDPIIIFNSIPANRSDTAIENANRYGLYRNIIYNNVNKYIGKITAGNDGLNPIVTSCENFIGQTSRQFYLIFFFSTAVFIMFLCFVLFISILMIKNEISANAKEYMIKKLHGYTNMELFKDLVFSLIIGDLAVVFVCSLVGHDLIEIIAAVGAMIIAADIIAILKASKKFEKANTASVIKDGIYG